MCNYLQNEQCQFFHLLNLLNTSRGMFLHFLLHQLWHASHSTIYKSGFLMWYQTPGILHIQNTSTIEIFSGKKKITVFIWFSRNGSTVLNIDESTLSFYFYQMWCLTLQFHLKYKMHSQLCNFHNQPQPLTRANVYLQLQIVWLKKVKKFVSCYGL